MASDPTPPVRWRIWLWPAVAILALCAAGLIWTWTAEADLRQQRIVRTLLIAGPSVILEGIWFVVWVLLLSRLRWSARLATLAVLALVVLGAAWSVEFRGVSGDVLPLPVWRWAPEPGDLPPLGAAHRVPAEAIATTPHDYPQFLGPHRDGSVDSVRLARDWSVEPPRLVWRQPIGAGWSGFAVVGGYAVTLEQRADEELVTCYDVDTGRLRWAHADSERFESALGGLGPRATPAIDGGRVFALGATGLLNALDLRTGETLWSTNIVEDSGGSVPTYGVSASPLVLGEVVVVSAGGADGRSLVAYDVENGERRWSGGSDPAAYSSPVLARLAGAAQILVLNENNLTAHAADDGRVLWRYPWPGGTEKVSQPVVVPGDRVFQSTGYGVGGKLFQVRADEAGGWSVDRIWESRGLKAKFASVVRRGGFLYGLDDGILVCLDLDSGKRRWKSGRYGHGQLILSRDLLVVLSERGEVALVEADPESFHELGRFSAVEGKTWGHPALAGRHLLVRNDTQAACYELPVEG